MEYSKKHVDYHKNVDYHKTVVGAKHGCGHKVMGAQTGPVYSPAVMGAQTGPVYSPAVMGAATPAPYPYVGGAQMGPGYPAPGYGASPVMPTDIAPAQLSPTTNTVNTNVIKTIVPHIHPSHNTTVNKHVFQHQHYFPHSNSVVNECYNQQLICCGPPPMPPFNPCCGPRPRPFGF
ncbi:CotD family spore coat protein [Peribacillus loiseleuriae]|uniref:CotD family spore coat protein n=1 Tax=Peribacillus loiseleuriae TaxID=1679170 RepID=UPI00380B881D